MTQKLGRGRPPKPARQRRSRRLPLMLTTAEYEALNRYCRRHKVSASEVARESLRCFLEASASDATFGVRQKGGTS
jgi:hypothetical protein